jgi:hypothetical protein
VINNEESIDLVKGKLATLLNLWYIKRNLNVKFNTSWP